MKNLLSLIFLISIFYFQSCSNQGQNQNAVVVQADTGISIASNNQHLKLDTNHSKMEMEKPVQNSAKIEQKNEIAENLKTETTSKTQKPEVNLSEKTAIKTEEIEPSKKIEKTEAAIEPVNKEKIIEEKPLPSKPAFNHNQWDQLLRKYVSSAGKVNYKGLKTETAKLDAYLKNLQENSIQDNWSRDKKMAYWINVYNAFTIKMIIDNYPVSSITKLHGGKPWDVKWIELGGKTYNLNNIENDILRPKFKDARIHFAVNCAAKSCPPLLNQAWTESNLNQLLEKQTKAFINNSAFNTISAKGVEISKIFEWYAVDFGNIVDYLNKYSTTKINKNAKIKYKEYDWALNE